MIVVTPEPAAGLDESGEDGFVPVIAVDVREQDVGDVVEALYTGRGRRGDACPLQAARAEAEIDQDAAAGQIE